MPEASGERLERLQPLSRTPPTPRSTSVPDHMNVEAVLKLLELRSQEHRDRASSKAATSYDIRGENSSVAAEYDRSYVLHRALVEPRPERCVGLHILHAKWRVNHHEHYVSSLASPETLPTQAAS